MAEKKEKLMIIDGNALIHRSFHALPPTMTLKDGTPINAVYGFASFLLRAMKDIKPEYVILTLDMKGPTFRHEKFKEYKAKRIKAPQELYDQIPMVKKLAEDFNIPVFQQSGFEADDLIGTIAQKIKNSNADSQKAMEVVIVTGDKDTLQLIDKNVKVYSMSRGINESILYDEDLVKEKIGVRVDQVIDYKALRGDPSDNIPGVPGIGDKTAIELLAAYDNLDNIYKKLSAKDKKIDETVKPRIVELLKAHKESAYLSQELATIKCDVPLDLDLGHALFKNINKENAIEALRALEFKSLLPRMQELLNEARIEGKEEKKIAAENKFIRNRKEFKYLSIDPKESGGQKKFNSFLKDLGLQKQFSFDTETSSFDPITCDLLGISFSWKNGEAYFIHLRIANEKEQKKISQVSLFAEKKPEQSEGSEEKKWLLKLNPILENGGIKKIAHNGKYDLRVLKNFGIDVKGFSFDTMIAAYLLDPGARGLGLDAVTLSEFGFEKISKDDLLGKTRERIAFSEVQKENLSLYSCEDADFTFRLVKRLQPKLKEQNQEKLFSEIEIPLIAVLAEMEENGIKLDKNFLGKMGGEVRERIKDLETKICQSAGKNFNINSTKQLKEILFEDLLIPTDNIKKTKTGFSTAADELAKLRGLHPIIVLLEEYRELAKLESTYIDALPKLINSKTGRVHTHYNQTITATGRLSSTDPNLQNIPVRTDLGRKIRQAFVAEKGCKLLALDYSQIELRLAAHMSGDKKMIKAFQGGADIHRSTAAEINQIDLSKVDDQMRREAKATNFGVLYGQGAHGLSQTAGISYADAKNFIDNYFAVFTDIKKYIDDKTDFAKSNGYAETLFGRRRNLPEINSSVVMIKKAAERMAVNTPLQGTAADMLKVAMIKIQNEVCGEDIKMVLTVHDELIFEVKENLVETAAKRIKKIMEEVIKLDVPVVVDVKVGDNWGEMEKVKF